MLYCAGINIMPSGKEKRGGGRALTQRHCVSKYLLMCWLICVSNHTPHQLTCQLKNDAHFSCLHFIKNVSRLSRASSAPKSFHHLMCSSYLWVPGSSPLWHSVFFTALSSRVSWSSHHVCSIVSVAEKGLDSLETGPGWGLHRSAHTFIFTWNMSLPPWSSNLRAEEILENLYFGGSPPWAIKNVTSFCMCVTIPTGVFMVFYLFYLG